MPVLYKHYVIIKSLQTSQNHKKHLGKSFVEDIKLTFAISAQLILQFQI